MPQFNLTDITDIYWASNEGFKGGRDPLGIQNSSVATYSKLLPGLTNLTGHIRYYSLYCWLLDEYDKLENKGACSVHQYNFIRRAELAMALLMKDEGVRSVVGALFVSQGDYNYVDEGVYNLADGADFDSKKKYWSFMSGAFGQYYLGSLVYYELVKIEERRFYLCLDGKNLAVAFRKSIDDKVRDLFIECLCNGRMAEADFEVLSPLALNNIVVGSEEWNALNDLLIREDKNGSNLRQQSIFLFLRDIDRGVSVDEFSHNRFLCLKEDLKWEAARGWYFYYLCEALHFCIETIFCLILNRIDNLNSPSIDELLEDIQKEILPIIKKPSRKVEELRFSIGEKIDIILEGLKDSVNEKEYALASTKAIILMLSIYTEFEKNRDSIMNFESSNGLTRQRGILSEGLNSYVVRYLELSIQEYIKTVVLQIMQEHVIVAVGKMGNSNSDLRKFIIEDGRLFLVEIRYPTNTRPRIDSLFNFLQDLGYLNQEGQLTQLAYDFIDTYGKE